MAKEKNKVCQKQKRDKHGGSKTMIANEIYRNISNIATHAKNQAKHTCDLERVADDNFTTSVDDAEDTNILGYSDQKNKSLGCQPQSSKRPNTLPLGPSSGNVFLLSFKTVQICPRETRLSAVALNAL